MDFKNRYFNQWGEAWNFHKKWCNNNCTDEEWDAIILEAGSLMKKSEFMKGLILVVIDELDRLDRQKRKDGANNE